VVTYHYSRRFSSQITGAAPWRNGKREARAYMIEDLGAKTPARYEANLLAVNQGAKPS